MTEVKKEQHVKVLAYSVILWIIQINNIVISSTLQVYFMPVHVNFLAVSVCDSLSL